jgi:CheY-like chemotaxis protein
MLKKSGLERKKRDQYLDIVISKGNQLMEILNNIIDISKIEENQIQLNNEECCLYDIFSELKDFYENELVKNNKEDIQFLVNLETIDKDLRFYADTARLQQIFSNLLSNAVKFTESGSIELGFTITDGKELIFYVKDSGIGIDPDKHILIFERFRQIDESFTRSYGGNGLGLTICKGLIKLFGGNIWVESDGNNGSTFYFSIPFHRVLLKNEQNIHDHCISENVYDWSGRKILIVEDDLTCYEFLSEVLLLTNCVFEHASSGPEALKRFSRTPFDLVLLDMQLPEVDGYQIAHAIRKTNPHIPIIAQTAHAMSDDKQKCINAGCNEYIAKPLHFEHLLETINSFLS